MWYFTALSHFPSAVSSCFTLFGMRKEISACNKSVHMRWLHNVSATYNSELPHGSFNHPADRQRRAFKPTFVKGVPVSVSNIWKHVYVQLSSEPVESGGHRLHTELEESLTEDDAGADQRDAARDGGYHDCQDQRCRHLSLHIQALRSCWEKRVN